jgi:hypothetical protein
VVRPGVVGAPTVEVDAVSNVRGGRVGTRSILRVGGGVVFAERPEGDEGLEPECEALFLGLKAGKGLEPPLSLFDGCWTWADPFEGKFCADAVLPILRRLEKVVDRREALAEGFATEGGCDQKSTALLLLAEGS